MQPGVPSHPVRTGFCGRAGLTTLGTGEDTVREPTSSSQERRRKPPWLVLSLGFGGLLVFILAAAVGSLLVLDHVRRQETGMRQAFLGRLSALDQIRSGIYLSGTYVRDFLLSPDASGAQAQSARLEGLERETRAALDAYARSMAPEERNHFRTCGRKSTRTGGCWTARWRGRRRNATGCATPSFMTSWCRAVPPCCRLPTAQPPSTSAG